MAKGVTDAELALLQVLWKLGHATTAKEIAKSLYRADGAAEVGSTHTLLQRLEKKELVTRDRSVHPHQFKATVGLDEIAGQELEAMAAKLTNGSLAPFICHLLQTKRLSRDEADEIRQMLKNYKGS